jgi:hypothetical protein
MVLFSDVDGCQNKTLSSIYLSTGKRATSANHLRMEMGYSNQAKSASDPYTVLS